MNEENDKLETSKKTPQHSPQDLSNEEATEINHFEDSLKEESSDHHLDNPTETQTNFDEYELKETQTQMDSGGDETSESSNGSLADKLFKKARKLVDNKRPFTQQKNLDEETQELNEEDDQENNGYQEETQIDLIDDETSKKTQQHSPQDLSNEEATEANHFEDSSKEESSDNHLDNPTETKSNFDEDKLEEITNDSNDQEIIKGSKKKYIIGGIVIAVLIVIILFSRSIFHYFIPLEDKSSRFSKDRNLYVNDEIQIRQEYNRLLKERNEKGNMIDKNLFFNDDPNRTLYNYLNIAEIEDKNPLRAFYECISNGGNYEECLKLIKDKKLQDQMKKTLEAYKDCIKNAKTEEERIKCLDLIKDENLKKSLLNQQKVQVALDCLKNAKTDEERNECLKLINDPEIREKFRKELGLQKELQEYKDCIKNAKTEAEKNECLKGLSKEAIERLKQQALDCLKNAKTDEERNECLKNIPQDLQKELLADMSVKAYKDCVSKARNEKEKKECEKLLTPEAKKKLEQQVLDCLTNAKTDEERKKCLKDLPKDLQSDILAKESLKAYKDCVSQAKNEAEKKECEKLLTPEAKKLLEEEAKESVKAYLDCVSQAKTEAEKKECEKLLTPEAKKKLEEAKESVKAYKDCVSQAKTEDEKKECEKLLTPEAKKLLEQQALDCLKNAKTEADKKRCIKDLPKDLQKKVLAKESVKAYLDCVSRARNEKEKKECEKLLTPEAKKLLEEAKESLKAYKDCLSQARNEEERRACEKLLTPEARKLLEQEVKKSVKAYLDCVSRARNEKEKQECEKLLTPEARKFLAKQVLDCLEKAGNEEERKACLKNLPKDLQENVLAKESLKAYKDCLSQARNEEERRACEKLLTPEARKLLEQEVKKSVKAYLDCVSRARNEKEKKECEKLLTPEARKFLAKELQQKDKAIKDCLKNADPNDRAAIMKCLDGLSDEEKLKYLQEAREKAVLDCLKTARTDEEKRKCQNLYSDLIQEIQNKRTQSKQNQLSKTERLHQASECLDNLDDPTDQEAIEQCLEGLSDSERALILGIKRQADEVDLIYSDLRNRKTFDNMAAKGYPLLPMDFKNGGDIATINTTNVDADKIASDNPIYASIEPDITKQYETEKTIKDKNLEAKLAKALGGNKKDDDKEKSEKSTAKAKAESNKIDKDVAETAKNISEIALKNKKEKSGDFVDENGNPIDDKKKAEKQDETSPVKQAFIGKSDPTFVLAQYTPIEITLTSKVDATLTGIVSGVVAKDVWNMNGTMILLDKGTKVYGNYQSVKGGTPIMTRLMIVFTKAITPDGVIIPLANAQAAGMLGEAGVDGYVNNHFMKRIGFAVIASVVNSFLQTAPIIALDKLIGLGKGRSERTPEFNYALGQAINGSMQSSAQMSNQILGQLMNIPPSFYKNEGDSIKILTMDDIDFSGVYDVKITNKSVVDEIIKQSTKTLSREHEEITTSPKGGN
ncbi:CagY family CD-EC repeat-containing protein [Helicobacter pylori]|uniref:CagY family CD-EC repeat-containing protein n=1 Tax=Helicobacter pylori TaxID=210 RepID=UPI002928A107|nr:CagY family CD-EC repeat-containing protein [Helicobacter pylori]MDU9738996.1 CagY family CD-EC repeat-containing protein [Helicobacter pylori]